MDSQGLESKLFLLEICTTLATGTNRQRQVASTLISTLCPLPPNPYPLPPYTLKPLDPALYTLHPTPCILQTYPSLLTTKPQTLSPQH